eukprot:scaffold2938_cov125-Isochrysis_galbana.AAC.9
MGGAAHAHQAQQQPSMPLPSLSTRWPGRRHRRWRGRVPSPRWRSRRAPVRRPRRASRRRPSRAQSLGKLDWQVCRKVRCWHSHSRCASRHQSLRPRCLHELAFWRRCPRPAAACGRRPGCSDARSLACACVGPRTGRKGAAHPGPCHAACFCGATWSYSGRAQIWRAMRSRGGGVYLLGHGFYRVTTEIQK